MKTNLLRIISALILAIALGGCSQLSRGFELAGGWLGQRAEQDTRGWGWEDWVTCDEAPTLHLGQDDGSRWCVRVLAPTFAECSAGGGQRFWFGDSLSGMNRQILFDLCADSQIGEFWPNLQGVRRGSRMIVHDANRGSKTR